MINQMTNMTTGLGLYLEREIAARGWSQREASRQLDVPFATLNNLIHGRHEPDLATLRKIARGLGVTVGRLLQAMNVIGEGLELPRPLRRLDTERMEYIDNMDEAEFTAFLDMWRKLKGDG